MPLQKHCNVFTKTLQWFAEGIAMKKRKARKRPEKRLPKARYGAETTVFTHCFY
jgi:hypothetical protein